MTSQPKRYNAGVQRAKGILEMASALYDSSLSQETERAGSGQRQVDSRVATPVFLRLGGGDPSTNPIGMSFAVGGFSAALRALEAGDVSVGWINPSVGVTMASRGKGPFAKPIPLRVLAVFPSWDVIAIAVRESTGITSIAELVERKPALRVSTRMTVEPPYDEDATMFGVQAVLNAAGADIHDIPRWGGSYHRVRRPSAPERGEVIANGEVDAVFDEGILSWSGLAIENGFRFLPIEGSLLEKLRELGFRPSVMTADRFPGLPADVPTIDFSGWPIVVREDMPDDVAYAMCEAIEQRRDAIPMDNGKPLDLAQLCNGDDDEAPRDVPFHPGAERFYRDRGLL